MDILAKLKSQAEQVEVVQLQNASTKVGFENNRLKSSQTEESSGTAVRVIKEGRLGFSATSDSRAEDKLIRNVLESAAYGDQVPLDFPGTADLPDVANFDSRIADLPVSELVDLGQEIVDTLLEYDPELQVNVDLVRGSRRFSLQNQTGFENSYQMSPLSVGYEVVRVEGDDLLIIWDAAGRTIWEGDHLAPAHRTGELLKSARKLAKMKSGRMPVIFSPKGGLTLALPLLDGLNGKNVFTDISPMKDKIGQRIFDPKLSVVDDPSLDGRFSSAPFDDEGVAARRSQLIEEGVVLGFYYDLKTAALSGVESTGNGSRGLFTPPAPSASNFIIEPGETALDEIIKGIDQGLLVEEVLGLGQGNTVSGAFSNTLSLAYRIEKGEIVGRVKDVSIAGNIYQVLQNVSAISREQLWVYYNFCLPYLLLDDLKVVVKE